MIECRQSRNVYRRDTNKWIPVADFKVNSIDGLGIGAVGDNSNLKRRSREDSTTFSSAMAKRWPVSSNSFSLNVQAQMLTQVTDAVPWSCTERNVGVRMTSFALFRREAIRIVRVRIRIKSWIVVQSVDRNDKFAVFR